MRTILTITTGLLTVVGVALSPATPALGGGVYTELFNFDRATDGCNPLSPALLAQGEDGILYSTLASGTSESGHGTIIDYAPGGTLNVLYRFQGPRWLRAAIGIDAGI